MPDHCQLVVLEYTPVGTATYRWPTMQLTLQGLVQTDTALAQLRRRRQSNSNGRVVFTDQAYADDPAALGETLTEFLRRHPRVG
ncbi:MAG: hypothetical protein KJ734_04075 [Chloroflexi bacterium]|nr:hypothetical protein [Chloroflexota bacterium]